MPHSWRRSGTQIASTDGWRPDPEEKFPQRFYGGCGFTPYVGSPERALWDLGYSGRIPNVRELENVLGMALADVHGRVTLTLTDNRLTLEWAGRPGAEASAIVSPGILESYELRPAVRPECLELHLAAALVADWRDTDDAPLSAGMINLSIVLGREHESVLCELREYIAGHYQRPQLRVEREEPARSRPPTDVAVDAGDRGRDESVADGQPRSAPHTLAVTVETAPDNDDWLSFAAPSVDDLIRDGIGKAHG
jgi:hypothetical protein